MRRLAWSQLRFGAVRTVALLAGMLVAATAFTVLTAASRTSQLRTTGTVSAHFRAAYDILVRPRGRAAGSKPGPAPCSRTSCPASTAASPWPTTSQIQQRARGRGRGAGGDGRLQPAHPARSRALPASALSPGPAGSCSGTTRPGSARTAPPGSTSRPPTSISRPARSAWTTRPAPPMRPRAGPGSRCARCRAGPPARSARRRRRRRGAGPGATAWTATAVSSA